MSENLPIEEDFAQDGPHADSSPEAMLRGLEFLRDIPLEVTVELGTSRMTLGDVLALGPSSLIELNKANGEPLDVKVNGVLVARGEAVVVNERFGVRLTSVMEPAHVLKTLQS
ncbi:MAG: flagellar motor switch protein FliN [Myxococcota bacterium]